MNFSEAVLGTTLRWFAVALIAACCIVEAIDGVSHSGQPVALTKRNAIRDDSCPPSFLNRCHCGFQPYPHADSQRQFVVNCSNAKFTDADMLVDLPLETEVLIFTGNLLNELDNNAFGFEQHLKLNYIDLSNNHLSFIRGQSFHRVRNVETLILNFNQLKITDRFERSRIFSNFENLKFLHLTDAFTDTYNGSTYYMLRLEDIFIDSNLTTLERLHLEQNEIFSIGRNRSIFCPLTRLQQLYLSDNKLGDMDFRIDCLEYLNHIDMRYNMITRFSDDTITRLDNFVSKGRPLSINILDNPLVCDCRSRNFIEWLKSSGVQIDKLDNYICTDGYPVENIRKFVTEVTNLYCPGTSDGYSSSTVELLTCLIVLMVFLIIGLGFYHKHKLSHIVQPLVNDLTRKVGYKGLAHEEAPTEVNV